MIGLPGEKCCRIILNRDFNNKKQKLLFAISKFLFPSHYFVNLPDGKKIISA
jgi:hypothetical protein